MLPGNENRITAAHHSGTPRQEIKKRFPVFLHPKPSRILHRNKIIQLLSENIAKISVFPVVSNIGKNNCREVWHFLKPSVYHCKTELIFPFLSNSVTKTRKEIPGNFARFALPCVVVIEGEIPPHSWQNPRHASRGYQQKPTQRKPPLS